MQDNLGGENNTLFTPYWSVKALPNWKVLMEKIPTKDKWLHRGIQLGNNFCEMCKEQDERVIHLLFSCKIA